MTLSRRSFLGFLGGTALVSTIPTPAKLAAVGEIGPEVIDLPMVQEPIVALKRMRRTLRIEWMPIDGASHYEVRKMTGGQEERILIDGRHNQASFPTKNPLEYHYVSVRAVYPEGVKRGVGCWTTDLEDHDWPPIDEDI